MGVWQSGVMFTSCGVQFHHALIFVCLFVCAIVCVCVCVCHDQIVNMQHIRERSQQSILGMC